MEAKWNIVPMNPAYAEEMSHWSYGGEYSFYDRNGNTDYPEGEASLPAWTEKAA